jgi:hypothetical protein
MLSVAKHLDVKPLDAQARLRQTNDEGPHSTPMIVRSPLL